MTEATDPLVRIDGAEGTIRIEDQVGRRFIELMQSLELASEVTTCMLSTEAGDPFSCKDWRDVLKLQSVRPLVEPVKGWLSIEQYNRLVGVEWKTR